MPKEDVVPPLSSIVRYKLEDGALRYIPVIILPTKIDPLLTQDGSILVCRSRQSAMKALYKYFILEKGNTSR